ncbi:hypothetical protein GCM10023084_01070 [Streptomyces lacrimifluminis]|uniref:Uncharacterized protein n=1 Tax=Streptomyces lacrimifluminis TaxID=1500077 RepID=A0A917KNR3_9ACTN|nr:hypothetical protein [Streptomyces lacrimifluminis]GGJ20556.1 hypothetical protein GCM10012282_16150 [Streptomyces lacrimifluminis]
MTHALRPAWTPDPPYVSSLCTIGTHDQCRDAKSRESGIPELRYLVCTCCCHRVSPVPVNEASQS